MDTQFITLEGIEGVGKSTCLSFVEEWLKEQAIPHILTREPGGTSIAEAIRDVLLSHHDEVMSHDTELLLMFASRAQHISDIIKPALADAKWVVSDRFTDASYAYQGGGREIDLSRIAQLEQWVQGDLRPNLTLLLDAPTDVAFARAKSRSLPDRIEQEGNDFFNRVRNTYLARAKAEPDRFVIIDASLPLEAVRQSIVSTLDARMLTHA